MSGNVIERALPPVTNFKNAVTINPISVECVGPELAYLSNALASAAWTANLLIFLPLVLVQPTLVSQFFWLNGSAVNGNTDVGIYTEDGTSKLASAGPTLNAGTSQIQVVNISDVLLPGNRRYWLALGSDSSTQTYSTDNPSTRILDHLAVKQQAAGWSSGLPSSATFAVPSVALIPLFGFTGTTI